MRKRMLIAVATALAMVAWLGVSPASAADATATQPLVGRATACAAEGQTVSPAERAHARTAVRAAVRAGEVAIHADASRLDLRGTRVYAMGEYLVTSTPIKGLVTGSALNLMFDETGTAVLSSETHFSAVDFESGHAAIWNNGDLVLDRVVHNSENQAAASAAEGMVSIQSHGFWRALNQCLSSAGISAWVVAAALAVCTLATPVGTIACLAAVGVGGGTAGYCTAYAYSHR